MSSLKREVIAEANSGSHPSTVCNTLNEQFRQSREQAEVREASSYFDDLPNVSVPNDMLSWLSTSSRARPATFADRYEEAVVTMLRTKQSGRTVSTSEPRFRDEKVFDLMEPCAALSLARRSRPRRRP